MVLCCLIVYICLPLCQVMSEHSWGVLLWLWRWGGWEDVQAPALGRETLGRAMQAGGGRALLCLLLSAGDTVASQASLCIWFTSPGCISVVGIATHWAHLGLEGSSALPDLYRYSTRFWWDAFSLCQDSREPVVMEHNGMRVSMTNLQVQMNIAHLGTGLANFPGKCVNWISCQKRAY